MFPRAEELHLYAGFPCVHLSAVRAFRRNLQGEGSNLFWYLLQVMEWVFEVFSAFCKVKFCVENV
jgi:site-specific DNA-cytosine methylase